MTGVITGLAWFSRVSFCSLELSSGGHQRFCGKHPEFTCLARPDVTESWQQPTYMSPQVWDRWYEDTTPKSLLLLQNQDLKGQGFVNLAKGTLADFVVFGDRNENKTKEIVLFENEGSRLAIRLGTYWTIFTVTLQISKFFFLSFLILFITAVLLSVLFYLSLPISFLPTFSDRYSASSSLSVRR